MATRGVSTVVTYRAWDTSANTPKTGDSANHTLRWIKDGTSAAPTNSPSEVDATNAPGVYKLTLTATETDCVFGVLSGKSGTANVSIFGVQVGFEYVPTSSTTFGAYIGNGTAALAVDASGHVDLVDAPNATAVTAIQSGLSTSTVTDAIKAKTDNLPTDPADESLIIAATDSIQSSLTSMQTHGDSTWATATGFAVAGDAMTLTSAYDFAKGTAAMTESYAANGVAPTPIQALFAVHQMLMSFSISGTSYTVNKLDGSTTAFTVTLNDATSPTGAAR